MNLDIIKSALFGVAVGDALGVPVEFKSRIELKANPVTDMLAFGTHNQPAGTWSDDSSLTFCLVDSLCKDYNLTDIANKFLDWYNEKIWTPHGKVFDIGIATNQAMQNIKKGHIPFLCGGFEEFDNGNGSLMRILPIAFYVQHLPIEKRFDIIKDVSAITHAHIRSKIACFIYIELVLNLLQGKEKFEAYEEMKFTVNHFFNTEPICSQNELDKFHRVLGNKIGDYDLQKIENSTENEIVSDGYVLSSLEASIWCFLHSNSFEQSVLKAVNLGSDTDTTGAITGGMAGIYYGIDNIPTKWLEILARNNDINSLCEQLEKKYK